MTCKGIPFGCVSVVVVVVALAGRAPAQAPKRPSTQEAGDLKKATADLSVKVVNARRVNPPPAEFRILYGESDIRVAAQ